MLFVVVLFEGLLWREQKELSWMRETTWGSILQLCMPTDTNSYIFSSTLFTTITYQTTAGYVVYTNIIKVEMMSMLYMWRKQHKYINVHTGTHTYRVSTKQISLTKHKSAWGYRNHLTNVLQRDWTQYLMVVKWTSKLLC